MEATRIPPEDFRIRRKAAPYAMFADGIRAYLGCAFRRGATRVRICFSQSGGSLSVSDNGRALTKGQLGALKGMDDNAGRSEYEKLALALVTHAQYVSVYNGEIQSAAGFSMPSTSGWCQEFRRDDVPESPVRFEITYLGRPECSIAEQKRDADTLVRLLPAMLSPKQRTRVTVVDQHGIKRNLGGMSDAEGRADWIVIAPKPVDGFTALDRIGWNGGPTLLVGEIRVSVRKALATRRVSLTAEEYARLLPLASPWLGAEVTVTSKDAPRLFAVAGEDFSTEAYADGTVDAILRAVAQTEWPRVATNAVEISAKRLLDSTGMGTYMTFRGKSYRVRIGSPRVDRLPAVLTEWKGGAGGEVDLDPFHPIFHLDAYSRSIHDRILWCVADLLRADTPVHEAYLDLRAALSMPRP